MCQSFPSLFQGVHSLRTETRHHFQPHHKPIVLRVEAPGVGDDSSRKTTVKGSLTFHFHHLHKPQQQDGQAEKVMLWGEGVPGLQPAWPGGSGSSTDISSRSCRSQSRHSSTCQEKQPAAGGECIRDRTQGKGSKEGQGTEKEGSSSNMEWNWG